MKNLSYYTLDEFKEICSSLPCDMVEIVYGYFHRDKMYKVEAYALSKGI